MRRRPQHMRVVAHPRTPVKKQAWLEVWRRSCVLLMGATGCIILLLQIKRAGIGSISRILQRIIRVQTAAGAVSTASPPAVKCEKLAAQCGSESMVVYWTAHHCFEGTTVRNKRFECPMLSLQASPYMLPPTVCGGSSWCGAQFSRSSLGTRQFSRRPAKCRAPCCMHQRVRLMAYGCRRLLSVTLYGGGFIAFEAVTPECQSYST